MMRLGSRRGGSMIEFVFIGIPTIFTLISIVEAARGMWIYTTLAHAVKEGTRYAIMHGSAYKANCIAKSGSIPACQIDLQQIAQVINTAGPGLIPSDIINLQFSSNGTTLTCGGQNTLSDCLTASGVTWADPDLTQSSPFAIRAQYRFASGIAMFWPGAGTGSTFPSFNLPASSQEMIQF